MLATYCQSHTRRSGQTPNTAQYNTMCLHDCQRPQVTPLKAHVCYVCMGILNHVCIFTAALSHQHCNRSTCKSSRLEQWIAPYLCLPICTDVCDQSVCLDAAAMLTHGLWLQVGIIQVAFIIDCNVARSKSCSARSAAGGLSEGALQCL